MKNIMNIKSFAGVFGILVLLVLGGHFSPAAAQNRYAIDQAQQAVRDKIIRDKGGDVTFPNSNWAETYYISNYQTGVRGEGLWTRNSKSRYFTYDARVGRNGYVDNINYKFTSESSTNVPSWALGRFYGRNPQTGGTITLDISNNGQVLVTFENGSTNYASVRGDRFFNNGVLSKLSKISNGIRTTRIDNGEVIDYYVNNNSWNNNNTGGNVPSWAVGTFYGRNPQTGGTIMMQINSNGQVSITFENGSPSYATMNRDRLYNNGIESKVTKIKNGIRTTRVDNGEAIDYYVNNNSWNNNVQGGNVPSWALGRFYGRNPQTGGTITLDINTNGQVTITFDNGSTSYATMNGDRLYNNGIESKVTKIRNGIRTTRVDNGEAIDYRR
ncbi:MAG: hypothetical protein JSS81_10735 [Acidobacteria bacterium]|nr:hypothetical protein [Acidobacteriota bacterium]